MRYLRFFFNDTATTEIYTLSLHDALPILAASRLVLEITESVLLDDWHVNEELDALRRLGVRIAVDDFGTGWSSDRKSTRLNSSHANISYAVFCLKKTRHGGTHNSSTPVPS